MNDIVNINYPSILNSNEIYRRALKLIPAATQTLAKGPAQYVQGVAPKYLQKGKGSYVWDVDGNKYIDLNMGVGPLILGYAFPEIDEAIQKQLKDGITFSLMHPLEVEVSELIHEVVPTAEAIRFSKTGADVTSAAIRLARAYTGKNKVLCCGYHGWHDWYISVTDRNLGIPSSTMNLTYTFNYNDVESLINSIDDDIACIILEPVVFEEPKNNFLDIVRSICDENNIVLIFDEMWTGFRMALGGAQEYFKVKADLVCFSKAVANGMPLSILTGKWDIMKYLEKEVFFFTTFGGEALSLAAAKATIQFLQKENVLSQINNNGSILKEAYNNLVNEYQLSFTKCVGYGFRTNITFNPSLDNPLLVKSLMQQEMIKRGVLWSGFHNLSYSHSYKDICHIISVYNEVLPIIKEAVESGNVEKFLSGPPVEPVFRKTNNFNTKPISKKIHKVFDDYKTN
jgi:glutamate-1-semialdehyde aminotransferase